MTERAEGRHTDGGLEPPLYILAGGRSRRFGTDKARALHRGVPLVASVARALAPATRGRIVVAATAHQYDDLGLTTIGDLHPGRGPLGGLVTALADLPGRHPESKWLLLAACDLVDPQPEWVRRLTERAPGATAVAFRSAGGWEPVLALYHLDIASRARQRLVTGDLSLQALLDEAAAIPVPLPTGFRHVSFPQDLEGAP